MSRSCLRFSNSYEDRKLKSRFRKPNYPFGIITRDKGAKVFGFRIASQKSAEFWKKFNTDWKRYSYYAVTLSSLQDKTDLRNLGFVYNLQNSKLCRKVETQETQETQIQRWRQLSIQRAVCRGWAHIVVCDRGRWDRWDQGAGRKSDTPDVF